MNVQPTLSMQANSTMEPTSQRWLYLGPLRQESLNALLAQQSAPEHAEFIAPEVSEDTWRHIIAVLPNAQQRTAKLAQHAGEQPYYRYNLPEFNASHPATGLRDLYPGLVLEDDTLARLEPLQSLIDEIVEQPVHTLVVEQPELAQPLLEGLKQTEALAGLQRLWLRTGQQSLYENTPRQAELLAWCEQHGFELSQRLADDPDFPLLQLRRNPLFDALQSEKARNTELAQERDALKAERQALHKQAEEQATALEKLQAQLAEQAGSNDTLEQANEALREEVAHLKERRNELKHLVEKHQNALEQATEEKRQLSQQLDEQKSSAQEVEKARAQLETEKSKLQAELKISREQLEGQQKAANESHQQWEKLNKRLSEQETELNHQKNAVKQAQENQRLAEQALQQAKEDWERQRKESDRKKVSQGRNKFSSDADIDDFLKDIEPYFYKRHLTYVDVGAFVGEVFLKMVNSGRLNIREAHLYEPNPDSYEKLKKNIAENKVSSVHAHHLAISDREENKTFSAAKSMTKASKSRLDLESSTNTFECETVPLSSLTELLADGQINLLKIDVEGGEIEVLKGGQRLFKEQRVDVIYIEAGLNTEGGQQTYLCKIDAWLQSYGYRVFRIYEQKNEWISDSPILRRCNVAYMSDYFASKNPYLATMEIYELKREIESLNKK